MIRDYLINIALGSGVVVAIALIAGFIAHFPWIDSGALVLTGLVLVLTVWMIGDIVRSFLEEFFWP